MLFYCIGKKAKDTDTGMGIGLIAPNPPHTRTRFFSMLKKLFRYNIFLSLSLSYAFLVKFHPIIYLISYSLNHELAKFVNLTII